MAAAAADPSPLNVRYLAMNCAMARLGCTLVALIECLGQAKAESDIMMRQSSSVSECTVKVEKDGREHMFLMVIFLVWTATLACACFGGYKMAKCTSRVAAPVRTRSAMTQSQTTYALEREQPRFIPLADSKHGCWIDVDFPNELPGLLGGRGGRDAGGAGIRLLWMVTCYLPRVAAAVATVIAAAAVATHLALHPEVFVKIVVAAFDAGPMYCAFTGRRMAKTFLDEAAARIWENAAAYTPKWTTAELPSSTVDTAPEAPETVSVIAFIVIWGSIFAVGWARSATTLRSRP